MIPFRRYVAPGDVIALDLGDIHLGNPEHDPSLLQRAVDLIKSEKEVVWFSTGDMLDVALAFSLADIYDSKSPSDELNELTELLAPIAHKCIGIVSSNHHNRFEKAVGISLDQVMCDRLRLLNPRTPKDLFLGHYGFIRIDCGENRTVYYNCLHHGFGAGRLRGAKAINLERLSSIYSGADVYIEGHTHTYQTFITECHYVDRKRSSVVVMYPTFVTTGHCLTYGKGYAARKKLPPAPAGFAMLHYHRCAGRSNSGDRRVDVSLFRG